MKCYALLNRILHEDEMNLVAYKRKFTQIHGHAPVDGRDGPATWTDTREFLEFHLEALVEMRLSISQFQWITQRLHDKCTNLLSF